MGCGNPPVSKDKVEDVNKRAITDDNPPVLNANVDSDNRHAIKDEITQAVGGVGTTDSANHSGAHQLSFPLTSPGYPYRPWNDMQGTFQSFPHDLKNESSRVDGYVGSNILADSVTDANRFSGYTGSNFLEDSRSDTNTFGGYTGSNFLMDSRTDTNPTVMKNELSEFPGKFSSRDYCKPEAHINFMQTRGQGVRMHPFKGYGAESKTSESSGLQMHGSFCSSGCSTSLLPPSDNFGLKGVKKESNNLPIQLGPAGKLDGSFLTLGIGGSRETRPGNDFSTREIATKLGEAASFQPNSSYMNEDSNDLLSLTHLGDKATEFQTTASGLPSSANNLVGRMPSSNQGGLVRDISARSNFIPFSNLHAPQIDEQTKFPAESESYRFVPAPSSLPFRNTSIYHPGQANSSLLRSGPMTPYFASQTNFNQQQDLYGRGFMNVSSESSQNPISGWHRGSSVRHAQLGQPYSFHNANSADALRDSLSREQSRLPVPNLTSFQSSVGGSFPKRLGVQPNDIAAGLSAGGAPPIDLTGQVHNPFRLMEPTGQHQHAMPVQFPKDFPAGPVNPVANLDVGSQASSRLHLEDLKRKAIENSPLAPLSQRRKIIPQPHMYHSSLQESQSIQAPIPAVPVPLTARVLTTPVPATARVPAAPVPATARVPAAPVLSTARVPAALVPTTARVPAAPVPATARFPAAPVPTTARFPAAPVPTTARFPATARVPVAPFPSTAHVPAAPVPTTARVPVAPVPATARVPATAPVRATAPVPAPAPVRATAPVQAATVYIKWQGFDTQPQPIGEKCHLCKRDLSFTAEGPVYQPSNLPKHAVLPCGHTFHADCLEKIIPKDQLENPPCIPCVLEEDA